MRVPTLGTAGGRPLGIDVERLLETRALLTASSGWGKSWALRRLIEQTHGRGAMQLVIDPEGEFASLRERFDFVIAGKGGDCPAEPRSADMLARRLLELGASAVLDLYELSTADRVRFVRRFLEALVDAPKSLWRPALVVIDEAHMFAPEGGACESRDAVRGVMTRGRKRGFAGILATQRLAKLDKDSCDAGNVMVGRYTLDVDVARAAASLGFPKSRFAEIQRLGRGEFWCYGPALSDDVVRVQVGDVATTHPKSGTHAAAPPAPRGTVVKVLEQLRDLPAEAEAEARTADELRAKLRERERELAAAKRAVPAPDAGAIERARSEGEEAGRRAGSKAIARVAASAEAGRERAARAIDQALAQLKVAADALREPIDVPEERRAPSRGSFPKIPAARAAAPPTARSAAVPHRSEVGAPRQRILDELLALEGLGIAAPTRTQLALWCEVSPTSGGFFNNLGGLRSAGLIDYPTGGSVALTDDGRATATPREPLSVAEMQDALCARVGAPKAAILRALIAQYPDDLSREDLADAIDVSRTSGGYFNNLGALRTLGVIDYPSPGRVVALPVLFLEDRR